MISKQSKTFGGEFLPIICNYAVERDTNKPGSHAGVRYLATDLVLQTIRKATHWVAFLAWGKRSIVKCG